MLCAVFFKDMEYKDFYYASHNLKEFIKEPNRIRLTEEELQTPIGKSSVIHSHNTFPSVAQSLNCPIWKVPEIFTKLRRENTGFLAEKEIEPVNQGSFGRYRETQQKYIDFTNALLERINNLN